MVALLDGEKKLSIFITVKAQYRRVTDRRTGGHLFHGIVRAMHTSRAVKTMTMLSRFHLILERHGQTDGQMDGQTDGRIAISLSRVNVLTRDKDVT